MKQMGLEAEVRGLLEQGLENWPPLKSVGYKETVAMVKGALSEAAWLESIETSTMQLAKKQMTWFKRDPDLFWFQADTDWNLAKGKVEEHLLTEL
jgi:tRNA dimethylallyltransferase